MGFGKREIIVDGIKVPVDRSTLLIDDIDEAQRTAAQLMAFWASVYGSAEGEKEAADAFYREWRAKATNKILEADPKLAEWKVKAKIEAHKDFRSLKTTLAKAAENVLVARGMFEACSKRANLAQSLGAKARETYRKTGETDTRADTDDGDSAPVSAPKPKASKVTGDTPAKREKLATILKSKRTA